MSDLIRTLRDIGPSTGVGILIDEAADALEAANARIAELESQLVKANDAWLALSAVTAEGGKDSAGLTDAAIEAGWHQTFSTSNPFCPCDLKSFTKAVRWAEYAVAKEKR